MSKTVKLETATFGAGCFWGVEEIFREINGVKSTVVSYAGGHVVNPSYERVCVGNTGHTEAVQVEFNPGIVSYSDLLEVFWSCRDPTQFNRQGPDVGFQYRSVIFYHSPEQEKVAETSRAKQGEYGEKIATAIEPFKNFYKAEEYHQRYLQKRGLKMC